MSAGGQDLPHDGVCKLEMRRQLRFLKDPEVGYLLQVSSSKSKREYEVSNISLHMHPHQPNCLVLQFDHKPKDTMLFETEQAGEIHGAFLSYRKEAEDVIARRQAEEQRKQINTTLGEFIWIDTQAKK